MRPMKVFQTTRHMSFILLQERNNSGSITITVQNSDNWYHTANSWLEFEGTLMKSDGPFASGDLITFANNGVMFLFDNIKYLLSSAEVESVYYPGTFQIS